MNSNSLLSMGALIILALSSLNFNSSILETSGVEIENKVALTAFSLADDLIEEIKGKSFDETTKPFPTTNPLSLTQAADLGPDSGETYTSFDDIDDYSGYNFPDISAPHAENYHLECLVQYVDKDDPDHVSTVQTFYKKVTVTVTNPYMKYPVSLSFIFTLKSANTMDTILDLLGATFVGGIILLIMVNIFVYSSQKRFASASDLRMQQNAKTLAEIVNNDLRKVGFKYNNTAIITAEPQKFSFYADIDSNGTADQVTYSISDSTEASGTVNPRDKVLYRIVNGDTSKGPSLGLTKLNFTYKNFYGNETSALDSIKYIKVEMWIETTEPVDDKYPFTYWEMNVNPRNIN